MERFMNWMGDVVAPKMEALTENAWLSALQKAVIKTLPMVLVLSPVNDYHQLWPKIQSLPSIN